jgi:hypothetical protein
MKARRLNEIYDEKYIAQTVRTLYSYFREAW